jgi:hypothetical protein
LGVAHGKRHKVSFVFDPRRLITLRQLTRVATSQWAAKPPRNASFELTIPRYVLVHHTASQNPRRDPSRRTKDGAMVYARSIQNDHFRRGWSDSGHNFLNATGGFVLEGRTGTVDAIRRGNCVRSGDDSTLKAMQSSEKCAANAIAPRISSGYLLLDYPQPSASFVSF